MRVFTIVIYTLEMPSSRSKLEVLVKQFLFENRIAAFQIHGVLCVWRESSSLLANVLNPLRLSFPPNQFESNICLSALVAFHFVSLHLAVLKSNFRRVSNDGVFERI